MVYSCSMEKSHYSADKPNKHRPKINSMLCKTALVASGALLTPSCSIDSYNNDTTAVQCDDGRTIADLNPNGGVAIFTVHNLESDLATIAVRRNQDEVFIRTYDQFVDGEVRGGDENFGEPIPYVEGTEGFVVALGVPWQIDVREEDVVISGACNAGGM
jgi:hypothetical protein